MIKQIDRDAERLGGMDQLLSEYQKAIDALTRRAKAADAAFAGVCQVSGGGGGRGSWMDDRGSSFPSVHRFIPHLHITTTGALGARLRRGRGGGGDDGDRPGPAAGGGAAGPAAGYVCVYILNCCVVLPYVHSPWQMEAHRQTNN